MAMRTRKERASTRQAMLRRMMSVATALAGSDDDSKLTPKSIDIPALSLIKFEDKYGQPLNPEDYRVFAVEGNSMKYCHINDQDLIFATKGIDFSKLQLPAVVVLRKHKSTENQPQYKIRRAWQITEFKPDMEDVLKGILQSDAFQVVRGLPDYDGDAALIDDFICKRLPKFREEFVDCKDANPRDREVIISTTFHTRTREIRFSIHPVGYAIGQVIAAFPKPVIPGMA